MITFSFKMPRSGDRGGTVVVLVIEPENLERMKLGDPFDLQFRAYERQWNTASTRLCDVDLIICYEENPQAIAAFHKTNDMAGLMRYLERGRHHLPGYGDAQPPRKVGEGD